MRSCWSQSDTSINMIAPGVVLLGVLCLSSIIRDGYSFSNPLGATTKVLIVFSIFYVLPLFVAFVSARKYKVDCNGLTLMYPFGIKQHYLWSEFSEIALCKIHYASGSTNHVLGIRCAIGSENCVPRNATTARAQWSTMTYELMHFRKLISIYYTDERYSEFIVNCPYQIKDYRSLADRK